MMKKLRFLSIVQCALLLIIGSSVTGCNPLAGGVIDIAVEDELVTTDPKNADEDAADHLVLVAGDQQTATVGDAVAIAPKIQLLSKKNKPVSGALIQFTVASGGGSVSPAATLTDDEGFASTSWTLGTLAGVNALVATSARALAGSPAYIAFTATGVAGAVSLAESTVAISSASIVSGETATVTITLKDSFGNQILDGNQAANLSLTMLATGTSSGNFGAISSVVGSPGVYQSTFTASSVGTVNTFRTAFAGIGNLPDTSVTVTAGNPARLVLSGANSASAGVCSAAITVTTQDSNGNSAPVAAPMAVTLAGNGAGAFYTDSGCTQAAGGSVTISLGAATKDFFFKGSTAQTLTFTANSGALVEGTRAFTVSVGPADHLVIIEGDAQSGSVGSSLSTAFQVKVVDLAGNVVSGVPLTFTRLLSNGSVSPASANTDANGLASATLTLGTTAGTNTVRVERAVTPLPDLAASGFATYTFTATGNPGAADHLVLIDGDAQTAQVNTALAIPPKVQTVDIYGNAVSGVDLTFLNVQGSGTAQSTKVTTNASGYAQTTFWVGAAGRRDRIQVTRLGSVLPDAAASGNARLYFNESSSALASTSFAARADIAGSSQRIALAPISIWNPNHLYMVRGNLSGDVYVMQGIGNGTFSSIGTLTIPATTDVVVGDFNGDSKPDIAASSASRYIRVWFGDGGGLFSGATDYATLDYPIALITADLNRDGILDLVTTEYNSAKVGIFLGLGNGTFGARTDIAVGTNPYGVVAGDLNGDQKLDLVVANKAPYTISVLIGNGDGTFVAAVDYATLAWPMWLALGDLNSDGNLDVVVSESGAAKVGVFLGAGDGTLGARTDYAVSTSPNQVKLADFNGDGKLDIFTANRGAGTMSRLLGVGDGTFNAATNVATSSFPEGIAVGDINLDGRVDVIVGALSANIFKGAP
ncbi:MAG TPA: FG-GAP-like repeat-containing protein [Bdellovibrionota bacterium]|nr:FG-GAP-like repeat-containing protein [Bdellovibrionota bacterium]